MTPRMPVCRGRRPPRAGSAVDGGVRPTVARLMGYTCSTLGTRTPPRDAAGALEAERSPLAEVIRTQLLRSEAARIARNASNVFWLASRWQRSRVLTALAWRVRV